MKKYSKRIFTRYHIGDDEPPLYQQSDGILVTLRSNCHWWFNKTLGRAILKDISAGGGGFVAPHAIKIPKKVIVIFPVSIGIGPQQVDVVHVKEVTPQLLFYGIEWKDRSGEVLRKTLELYGDRLK